MYIDYLSAKLKTIRAYRQKIRQADDDEIKEALKEELEEKLVLLKTAWEVSK